MSRKLRSLAIGIVSTIGLIFGEVAMAIEEPAFETLEKVENIEVRQYRPFIVAETFVDGDMSAASNKGFRLIADYIFGNNLSAHEQGIKLSEKSEKIAMTAPVSVEPVAPSEKKSQ